MLLFFLHFHHSKFPDRYNSAPLVLVIDRGSQLLVDPLQISSKNLCCNSDFCLVIPRGDHYHLIANNIGNVFFMWSVYDIGDAISRFVNPLGKGCLVSWPRSILRFWTYVDNGHTMPMHAISSRSLIRKGMHN